MHIYTRVKKLSTKLGAVPQINPRFGTIILHNLHGHSLHIHCLTSLLKKTYCVPLFKLFFFSIWVLFHEHSRITGLQGKGEIILLTPDYHFHLLHSSHLDISPATTAESSPLHIASSPTRPGNLWFPSTSR